jgi:hypothetical protein
MKICRKLIASGNSKAITIPKECIQYQNAKGRIWIEVLSEYEVRDLNGR